MYETNSQNPSFLPSSQSYQPPSQDSLNSNTTTSVRGSEAAGAYLSSTPSPVDPRPPLSFPHPHSAPHSQDRFPHSTGPYIGEDRLNAPPDPIIDRYSRPDKYSTSNSSLVDQRRMSEPAVLGSANLYSMPSSDPNLRYSQYDFAFMPPNLRSSYVPSLQRVSSFESRDVRHESYEYPSAWKPGLNSHRSVDSLHSNSSALDQPISPLRPNFPSGLVSSPVHESHYGPSPPNTGNSTTSNTAYSIGLNHPSTSHSHMGEGEQGADSANRTYSFVALPGNAVKKRPRRRYDEIERLYHCSWPNCTKAYGTLNHLNAHVTMQKHGQKRSPSEFKELRKQWRKAKKESEAVQLVGTSVRRGDGNRYNDSSAYDSTRFGSTAQSIQRSSSHMNLAMPSGPAPQSSPNDRYTLSADELRYPVDQRDEQLGGYLGDVNARPRYGEGAQASWPPAPSRSETQYPYPSVPSQHHGQMAQINAQHEQPPPPSASPRVAPTRLPPNSTLLTPLAGYQTHNMLPPLQTGQESNYDVYDKDSAGRPGTGHASIGPGSGDEYERRG